MLACFWGEGLVCVSLPEMWASMYLVGLLVGIRLCL